MEESIHSSLCSSCSTVAAGSAASEESGWTMYLEDFMAATSKEKPAAVDAVGGSSMISDAASCVPQRPPEEYKQLDDDDEEDDDDSLQDTASSLVNTPKVTELSHLPMNPKNIYIDHREEEVGCRKDQQLKKTLAGIHFVDRTNEYAELKNRGLCLFPLSLLDYLGRT